MSVENTHYLGKEDAAETGDPGMINQSSRLDELARKLRPDVLQKAAQAFLPRESKSKARLVDLLSAVSCVYYLVHLAVVNNSPVFLVQHHYDWDQAEGYYFFVGTQQQIEQKLLELSQDRDNLVKINHWY